LASLTTTAARSQIIRGRDAEERSIVLEIVFCERIFAIRQSLSRLTRDAATLGGRVSPRRAMNRLSSDVAT
jgi:hypothetical protein